MLLENVFSKIIKTFPKNPLNSKNYSVSKLTAFCEIFTPAILEKSFIANISSVQKYSIFLNLSYL